MKTFDVINCALATLESARSHQSPPEGQVLWQRKVGDHRVYFYWLQIRLLADGKFITIAVHNCFQDRGLESSPWATPRETIEEAVQDAIVYERGYYETAAEENAYAYSDLTRRCCHEL